jgi:hypothetical protein
VELSIINEKLSSHFEAEQWIAEQRTINQNDPKVAVWSSEHPETMLYSYLDSFLEICEDGDIEFDLTYNTVKNVGVGLVALYQVQKKVYNQQKNADIIAKTLATVFWRN